MKETTIAASEFKAKFMGMLDEVSQKGTSLVITKKGLPVAKLVPIAPAPIHRPFLGGWKDEIRVVGDIVNFNSADDWTFDEANIKPLKKRRK